MQEGRAEKTLIVTGCRFILGQLGQQSVYGTLTRSQARLQPYLYPSRPSGGPGGGAPLEEGLGDGAHQLESTENTMDSWADDGGCIHIYSHLYMYIYILSTDSTPDSHTTRI